MQPSNLVIGVDVAKANLSCSAVDCRSTICVTNEEAQICQWLATLPGGCVIAMESTGRYHLLLARLALQAGFRVYVLNARYVYFYAKALGMRGKTDRCDAQLIARYAAEHYSRLHPWSPGTPLQQSIQGLLRRRNGITGHRAALRQLLSGTPSLQAQLRQLNAHFDQLLQEIDRQIRAEVESDAQMRNSAKLLQTVTGIGPVGSALLALLLTRIKFANADALVAYSGMDPRPDDSGQKRGIRRLSKNGPTELRRQMYLAGMAAAHSNALRPLYRSLRERGLKSTEACVILGRKLLRVAWAVWKSGKPFDATLVNSKKGCAQT